MARNYINKMTGQLEDSTVVGQEVEQYKRLVALGVTDEKDLAHRLATSVRAIRRMRKYIGD